MFRSAILLTAVCAGLAHAGDWPEFRGPTAQGHATDEKPLTEWSDTKNVAWKTPIEGLGWSSPVIVGGRVYLTSAVPTKGSKDMSLRVLCLDAKDGKIIWNNEVFGQDGKKAYSIHSKNSHASPTPIVSGERIYVHFGHEGTACLDLAGKTIWTNRDLRYDPRHGNGGSPVLVEGLLIYSRDGTTLRELIALDAKDGKLKWKQTRTGKASPNFSFSTPLVITVDNKKQLISPASDMVAAYDLSNGEEIWKARYKGYSVIPRPVYGHGMVFISTGYNTPELLAVAVDGKGDVTDTHIKWRRTEGAPHTPSPLLVGGELYLVSDAGLASCLDAKTGEPHWQKRAPGKGYSASPVYADGKVYLLSEDGVGTVLKAGKEFVQLAKNDLGERTLASYAVSDNALYIRSAKHLFKVAK